MNKPANMTECRFLGLRLIQVNGNLLTGQWSKQIFKHHVFLFIFSEQTWEAESDVEKWEQWKSLTGVICKHVCITVYGSSLAIIRNVER